MVLERSMFKNVRWRINVKLPILRIPLAIQYGYFLKNIKFDALLAIIERQKFVIWRQVRDDCNGKLIRRLITI